MGVEVTKTLIYEQADQIIKGLYGPSAKFQDGQYEAITKVLLSFLCMSDKKDIFASFHRKAISSTTGGFIPQAADLIEKTTSRNLSFFAKERPKGA